MVSNNFAAFAFTLDYHDVPETVWQALGRSFYDCLAVAAVGSTTDMAQISLRCASALYGPGDAGSARALMDG